MERQTEYLRDFPKLGLLGIGEVRKLCPVDTYEVTDYDLVPIDVCTFTIRNKSISVYTRWAALYYRWLLENAKTLEQFEAFVNDIFRIPGNDEGLKGVTSLCDTESKVWITTRLVRSNPTSPKCREALREAIVKRDTTIINVLINEGVPYGPQEIDMCRNNYLNDLADTLELPQTKGALSEYVDQEKLITKEVVRG